MDPVNAMKNTLYTAPMLSIALALTACASSAQSPAGDASASKRSAPSAGRVLETNYTNTHVVVASAKPFEQAVKDLEAELGKASTELLGNRLSAAKNFAELTAEMEPLAGRSGLITVAELNWGKVMSRVPVGMKARLFVIGNPLTAKKLLEAGGPEVGLYLPTKIYVYQDKQGVTQVTYDKLAPVMAQYKNPQLNAVAEQIDGVLAKLANSAAL